VASLVLGCLAFLYGITAIPALICGYVARSQIRERGENGGGLALAGIVLGWVFVALFAVLLVVFVLAAASGNA
jgi:hypothetical protein